MYGKIPVGKCMSTSSGKLKSQGVKYVIHTVGPVFDESEALFSQQLNLYNAIHSAF